MRNAIRRWRFQRLLRRKRQERHRFISDLFKASVLYQSTYGIARLNWCLLPGYVVIDIRRRLPRSRGQFSSFDEALSRMDELLLDNQGLEGRILRIPEYLSDPGTGINCGSKYTTAS